MVAMCMRIQRGKRGSCFMIVITVKVLFICLVRGGNCKVYNCLARFYSVKVYLFRYTFFSTVCLYMYTIGTCEV